MYSSWMQYIPANRELPRLILPHDHFGSHLDAARRSIDDDLEITNFDFAGQVLCDILPHTTLRNYLGWIKTES